MKTSSKPKQEGQNQRHAEPRQQPQLQPPTAKAVAVAARETLPAPVLVVLPQSDSSESCSSSTSSSSSCSMHLYGRGSSDTTSTSSSATALKTRRGKAADSKRRPRYSDASFPDRSKRSSSTDTGTVPEPQGTSRSKLWLYSVVAVILTIATASVISMSLRAADAEADESHEYVLPKKATTVVPPQCSCSKGSGTKAADHDDAATPDLRRGLTSYEPKQGTVAEGVDTRATGSQNKSATVGGKDKMKAAGGGNASAVTKLRGKDDAVPDDGAPQKLAGKATKSFVALKIGPGRRRQDARTSPTSRTPAKNDAGKEAVRELQTRAKQGQVDWATSSSSTTLRQAAGVDDKSVPSRTSVPALKAAANVERAVEGSPEKQLANEYAEREAPSAAAKGDVVGTSGHRRLERHSAS